MTCKWVSQTMAQATAWLLKNNNKKNITCVWFLVYFVSTSYRYIRCDEIVLLPITLDCRQVVRENFMKGQGVRVRIKVKNHCFMTKQRWGSVAATSRQHQKFGIIDISVATSDILTNMTSHVMFSHKFLMSDVLWTNLMLTGFLFFPHFFSFQDENKLNSWFLSFFHQSLTLISGVTRGLTLGEKA